MLAVFPAQTGFQKAAVSARVAFDAPLQPECPQRQDVDAGEAREVENDGVAGHAAHFGNQASPVLHVRQQAYRNDDVVAVVGKGEMQNVSRHEIDRTVVGSAADELPGSEEHTSEVQS